MKRYWLLLLVIASPLMAQNNLRYDLPITTVQAQGGNLLPVYAIPGAGIKFYSCSGSVCTTLATTYISASSGTACPNTPTPAQVVLNGTTACVSSADPYGNMGGWFQPGEYMASITAQGTTYSYYFSISSGSVDPGITNGVPNIFPCATGINAPAWCNVAITCADIGNPTWCSGSPTSPAQSTVWLANAIKQLPLQTLGDGVSTVHSGEVDFGPMTWLHIGQPPTEANPSGSPLFLNGNVTLDCKGGGFIVDGPLGLSDSWIGNGNIPSNVTRHKIRNCIFFDAYDAPTTPIVSEQTYPFDYNGHLANTVDWIVGSTASFVKNSRVLCEGCLNGLIVGFKTNHNPSSISNIADSTHMTTITLGQNVAPWTETSTPTNPIVVSNASAGNTQYCESSSLGNISTWPGTKAVLSGFSNSANNSPTLGFTVVSAALNCFVVNNPSGVFEDNTTGAMANVVPPLITDAITYTGTVGTPWVVTAPDSDGNQTYVGPNINEAYSGFSTDGKQVILAGFHNAQNNGTFDISGSLPGPAGQSLIAVYNPSGVAESGQTEDQSATALVHLAQMKGDSAAFFMGGDPLGVNAGPNNYAAQWSLDNVSTNQTTVGSTAHKFNFSMEIGGNNTYIGDVSHFHFAGARLAPLFAPAGVSNTGENISFTDGSFGASDYACIFHDGNPEFHFYGVSTDYCNHTTHGWKPGNGHVIYGFQPNITWDGGHWESNTPTWYTEWGTSRGYLYASHMVYTSNDANITIPAMFTLRGTRDFIKVGGWYRSDPTLFVNAWTDSPVGIISSFNHDDVYTTAQNVANLPYRERGIEGTSFNSVSGINTVTLFFQASAGDTLSINPYPGYTSPTVLTAVASGASGNQFNLGADAAGTMTNLAAVANGSTDANLSKNTYSSSGAVLTITPKTPGMLEAITVTDPNLQWRVGSAVASQPQQARTINNVSIQSGVNENMKTTGITTTADIQPVMAAGQTTSKFFGRDEDTYNGVYYDFSYTDDKNAANYFAMRLAGPSELQSFALASGSHVRLPQILSATGLGTDSSGNIVATSGGANGVQYNPVTTAYAIAGASTNADDAHTTSTGVTAGAWSCAAGICTVNTTGAHGLVAGDFVDCSHLASWPAAPSGLNAYDTGYGTGPVLTAATTTQFTFAYIGGGTPSGTGGTIYNANFYGVYASARQPFLNGHGTMYYRFGSLSDLHANFATNFSGITGTPKYLIINGGQNDISGASSVASAVISVELSLQSLWADAHSAGWTVIQTPILPTAYGFATCNSGSPDICTVATMQINGWLLTQAKQFGALSGGSYYDFLLDGDQFDWYDSGTPILGVGATGGTLFANMVNQAFAGQGGNQDLLSTWFSTQQNKRLLAYGGSLHSGFDFARSGGTIKFSTGDGGNVMDALDVTGLAGTGTRCVSSDSSGNLGNSCPAAAATAWGTITGTLSSQSDLNTALNAKAPTASPTFTGTPDASGATQFKLPVATGFTSAANGELGYDSTNLNWHLWSNAADQFIATFPVATPPTSGNCAEFSKVGNSWKLIDAGGACGISGGGVTAFSGDGTFASNSASTGSVTLTLATAAAHKFWGNNTGSTAAPGYQSIGAADLPSGIFSCTEVWSGSGAASALASGDDAISNNTCYNDSGSTRTITAVKCRSDNGSNTTTVNPTFGSAGTGTTILSGALTCGSSYAYSSTGTVSNASWTTGAGIDPAMSGTLTGTSIAMIVEYHY